MLKNVPAELQRGDPESDQWLQNTQNFEALQTFLKVHNLDPNLVRRLNFGNTNFIAEIYGHDADKKIIVTHETTTLYTRTIHYRGRKPTIKTGE